jgi:hypothetical protein
MSQYMTISFQNKNRLVIAVDIGRLKNKVPPLGLQKQSNAKDSWGMHCDRVNHESIVRGNNLKWADTSIRRPRGEVPKIEFLKKVKMRVSAKKSFCTALPDIPFILPKPHSKVFMKPMKCLYNKALADEISNSLTLRLEDL